MQLKPGPGPTQDNIRASAQGYSTHRQLGLQHSNYTSSRQLIRLYKVNQQWKNHSGIDPYSPAVLHCVGHSRVGTQLPFSLQTA